MSGFWGGYAKINDDVRHTYERIFYGRELTNDLTAAEVPGMGNPNAANVSVDNSTTNNTTINANGLNPDQTAFYGSVWGNGDAPPVGPGPTPGGPGPTLDGNAAQVEALPIEAPKIEPPSRGYDMAPGY